jgi:hypothetical protein
MLTNVRYKLLAFLIIALLVGLAVMFPVGNTPTGVQQATNHKVETQELFKLTEQRRLHILYGDGTGGGHKAGAGKPGKTEFPPDWVDDKIISTITRIANDSILPMRQSGKRYWLRMGEQDGLQVRVVLDKEHGEIVTGYPVEGHKNPQ